MPKLPDLEKEFDHAFEPIALALGFLLRDYNDLQEKFLAIFRGFLPKLEEQTVHSLWHAITNDRMQRAMLLNVAASECLQHIPEWTRTGEDVQEKNYVFGEIKWLVDNANALGQQRDTAAHSPVAPLLGEHTPIGQEPWRYIADSLTGHPRAKSLEGKRLLTEFGYYRSRTRVLIDYAHEWEWHLKLGKRWPRPERPQLPPDPSKQQDKTHPKGSGPKGSKRQPRSSPR